jgi:hypothetical protein
MIDLMVVTMSSALELSSKAAVWLAISLGVPSGFCLAQYLGVRSGRDIYLALVAGIVVAALVLGFCINEGWIVLE